MKTIVVAVIFEGGRRPVTGLNPTARQRFKPAVPIAGSFRMVKFQLSIAKNQRHKTFISSRFTLLH